MDLRYEELETLEAPGWLSFGLGVGVGFAIGISIT